jgi:16S rRNA U516 pseudouridylate synthase RsuA-like enzyme
MITTVAQRDGTSMQRRKSLTARTRPCEVERLSPATIRITLVEGRNRQIRKMLGALDYAVLNLKRVSFLGMSLDPLNGPGSWLPLAEHEMHLVEEVLKTAESDTENNQENDDIALDNE